MGGLRVLFIHEVHTVRGRAEDEFEAAIRDGWMPTLGAGVTTLACSGTPITPTAAAPPTRLSP